ncbi:MAG: Group II intron-encoded protein LtrA [Deltaproteobacteria bacterium ADurb.Bin135]|nr:MAG: Group II intron-encoded protein LtrA [Deltaproteobacteria bacterium ADurb.Bin135]
MNGTSSNTLTSEDISDRKLAKQWEKFPFAKASDYVKRLQTRIAKAVKNNQYRLARRLQYLLTHSLYAKVLAVQRVTKNRGRRSAGVDGEKWTSPEQKMRAALTLSDKGYRAKPLRRIYIPKPQSSKMRPLSIPTMYDRAMQALYAMALLPWAETTADKTSFGFRMKRNAQDAASYTFQCLSRKTSGQWILEGDIRGCFDNFAHQWMLDNIPLDQRILNQFLKAGFIYDGILTVTSQVRPRAG